MNLTDASILKIITDAYQAGQCNAGIDPSYSLAVEWHDAYEITEDSQWQPIESAPKNVNVMLGHETASCIYMGSKRFGCMGEPQRDALAWRDSNGRYSHPTHWHPLPEPPT